MSNIPYNRHKENEIFNFVSKFINEFQIGKLLFQCSAGREKGIPVMTIFHYSLCLLFSDHSHYMQRRTEAFEERFSKNTLYRFLNSVKAGWQRFTVLLASKIINDFMKILTDERWKDVFIMDNSLFERSRSKRAEFLTNVFDHCSMEYKKGYRMFTLGWSDGNSFVPVTYRLFLAAENKDLVRPARNSTAVPLLGNAAASCTGKRLVSCWS